jgi:hypothetical protein
VATIFNESAIAAEPAVNGCARQHLLTKDRVSGTRILLDRLTLRPGGEAAWRCRRKAWPGSRYSTAKRRWHRIPIGRP